MQLDFLAIEKKYSRLSKLTDPLERLSQYLDFEIFREELNLVLSSKHTTQKEEASQKPLLKKQSNAGRKAYDPILMFKAILLKRLYGLSDQQLEYQITDRISFQRFLGLSLSDHAPDEKTFWLFQEKLTKSEALEKLFSKFEEFLVSEGLDTKQGSIVDASFVEVPKQRNKKEENQQIKEGKTPESFEENPSKCSQKDTDARWAKKNQETHYGYKNHVLVDNEHKLIREYEVSCASLHDSQMLEKLLSHLSKDETLWADSAYNTPANRSHLEEKGIEAKLCNKGSRNRPLSEAEQEENRMFSKIRCRVEHIFGFIKNSMYGSFIRSIGIARAKTQIGLMNLIYNMKRYEQIQRLKLA